MIHAEVKRNDEALMQRVYHEPGLTLAEVLLRLEDYIVREQLNTAGECQLRVRFEGVA